MPRAPPSHHSAKSPLKQDAFDCALRKIRESAEDRAVNILSYNPGHDGAVAHLRDGRLVFSVEAEKDSNWRYTPIASRDLLDALAG